MPTPNRALGAVEQYAEGNPCSRELPMPNRGSSAWLPAHGAIGVCARRYGSPGPRFAGTLGREPRRRPRALLAALDRGSPETIRSNQRRLDRKSADSGPIPRGVRDNRLDRTPLKPPQSAPGRRRRPMIQSVCARSFACTIKIRFPLRRAISRHWDPESLPASHLP